MKDTRNENEWYGGVKCGIGFGRIERGHDGELYRPPDMRRLPIPNIYRLHSTMKQPELGDRNDAMEDWGTDSDDTAAHGLVGGCAIWASISECVVFVRCYH